MGTGWRRAFCTTIPRNSSDSPVLGDVQPSPKTSGKLGFFKTSGSNPSTPRLLQSNWKLRYRNSNNGRDRDRDDEVAASNASTPRFRLRPKTNNGEDNAKFHSSVIDNLNITPRLRCKTKSSTKYSKSSLLGSNPSSPRSPFSIFKSSLGFSRSNCGLCLQSVKTGHKTAIFTAECSHTFHFPCITEHVKKENVLACPICKTTWRDSSFLAVHKLKSDDINKVTEEDIKENSVTAPRSKTSKTRSQENFVKPKAYDDDEPLRTPRVAGGGGGGGIVPIPEAVEEENDEIDEEFQGFFVNPISSSAADEFRRDLKNVEVMLMPEVSVISVNQSYETYAVVLKVKAPPPAAAHMANVSRRAPIDLVAVLDVSASMGGAKLQMLKRAMRLVISSLGSADRLSIVAFSACPKRLLPLRRMHPRGQRSARRIIDQLACSRGSCAGEALRKATKVLEDRRERNPVASIILLSDGHEDHVQSDNNNNYYYNNTNSNHSNQRQPSSHMSSTRFAHVEIPVHTLEKTGAYSHDPAENAFTKCVGGLLSVVAQDLRVQLSVAPGSDPAEITAVYSCNGKPVVLNAGSVRFGDLYAEEEREVLVELRVPRSNTGSGSHHVLSARCCYNDPATREVIYGGEKALLVPRAQSVRSSCSPKIERLRNLFIATRAVAESRLLVEHNKLTTAHQLLTSARGLLMQSASAEEFVKGLESELVDVEWRVQYQQQGVMVDENGEPLTPTSAWRAAEKLAKVAVMKKSLNRVSDLHGFENARF